MRPEPKDRPAVSPKIAASRAKLLGIRNVLERLSNARELPLGRLVQVSGIGLDHDTAACLVFEGGVINIFTHESTSAALRRGDRLAGHTHISEVAAARVPPPPPFPQGVCKAQADPLARRGVPFTPNHQMEN